MPSIHTISINGVYRCESIDGSDIKYLHADGVFRPEKCCHSEKETFDLALEKYKAHSGALPIGDLIPVGVWRHYAGKHYHVLGVARQTETNEELVIYIPLYEHPEGGLTMQARPLSMWHELVNGVSRFTYIGRLSPKEKDAYQAPA